MCPGLTSPGAKLDQDIECDKTVVQYLNASVGLYEVMEREFGHHQCFVLCSGVSFSSNSAFLKRRAEMFVISWNK